MSPRWLLTAAFPLCLGCLCALGCGQRKDPSITLLERENRNLETVIWQWKDAYDEKCQQLDAVQRAYRSQKRLDESDEVLNPTMQPTPAKPKPASPTGAAKPVPRPARPSDPLAIPLIEGPQELPVPGGLGGAAEEVEAGAPNRTTHRGGVRPTAALLEEEGTEAAGPVVVRAGGEEPVGEVDAEVTHVVLNPKLTGGFDFDRARAGDEGLMVVIEPRNADGAYVPLPGELAVVILDPAEQGEAQRVARWDFDAAEAARHLRKSLFGKGIHLELRWPDKAPNHEIVRVVVRYTTADGRKLESRRDVSIVLPIESQGRWTPVGGSPGNLGTGPREEITTAVLPFENRPASSAAAEPTPSEPGLLELPMPAKTEWKAVEGR